MTDRYAELRKALAEYEEDNNSSSAWNYIQAAHPRVISHLLKERDALLGALRDYVAADEPWVERGYGVGGEVMERARAAIERAEGEA